MAAYAGRWVPEYVGRCGGRRAVPAYGHGPHHQTGSGTVEHHDAGAGFATSPAKPPGTSPNSEGDRHLGDLAEPGHDRAVDRLTPRGEGAQRPLAGRGEEPEVTGGRGGDLR